MEIKTKKSDSLNVELTITVAAADYADREKKKLNERRRTAEFKGFRKGMVPASLIKKVYGGECLADAVNDVLGEQIQKYIDDNKLNILGEPLTSEKQQEIEWVSGNDFTFVFDLGLSPEIKLDVVKEDTVNEYQVSVAAADKKSMAENLKKYYVEKKEEKTDEEIDKEVTERLKGQLKQEADWRLTKDIRDYFVKKAGVKLPEDFLKRWLFVANKGKVSQEDVEKEFTGFAEDFKWQLVRGFLMKQFGLKIEQKDITDAAEAFVTYQYAMYGMGNVPAEIIKDAVNNVLSDRRQVENLAEQVEDRKVLEKIRETITLKPVKITSAKFRELK
ncbi:MAG: trigger factor family protein [Bacteroidales bacterium]|nr:trigger factor family protein [Bacteroidales bacterium]